MNLLSTSAKSISLATFPCALLALCCAAPLCGQTPAQQQYPAPSFVSHARSVIEDVVVTDRSGQPVLNLTPGDFKVIENGKPQTVNFFQQHHASLLPPGPPTELPAMPPHVYTNVPVAPADDAVDVLLLDTLNTDPQDVVYARTEVKRFLDHAHPGTRLAIFALGKKLYCLQGFTTDKSALAASLTGKLAREAVGDSSSLYGLENGSDAQDLVAPPSIGSSSVASAARADGNQNFEQTAELKRMEQLLHSLDYLSHYLSAIGGRKNLIWFASTFPDFVSPDPQYLPQSSYLAVLQDHMRQTANSLTTARVAIYPVFAGGIMTDQIVDADQVGPGLGSASATGVGHIGNVVSPMGSYNAQAQARAATISTMSQLAQDTGGKAIYNTNDLDAAVQRDVADGANYYTLAYSPTDKKQDGHFRNVVIKLTDHHSGLHLSYRRGYNAATKNPPVIAASTSPLQPLLGFGLPNVTEILYGLRIEPATAQPTLAATPTAMPVGASATPHATLTRYSVQFMLKASDLNLPASADGTHTGKVELTLAAYDRDGKLVKIQDQTDDLNLTAKNYAHIQTAGLPIHLEMDLPSQPLQLETGVYDLHAGKAGTLGVALPAPTLAH